MMQSHDEIGSSINLNYITGVILSEDANRFEKMIFRISKGKVITIIENLEVFEKDSKVQFF